MAWEQLHQQLETQITYCIRLALDPQYGNAKAGAQQPTRSAWASAVREDVLPTTTAEVNGLNV